MKRIRLLGVALMAVFALGAIAAITASAEVTLILPEKGVTVKSKSGKGTLLTVGGSQVICQKDKGESSFTTGNLGTFKVDFEECKAKVPIIGSAPCTGTGEPKEVILLVGEVHYLLALLMEGKPKEEKASKLVAALAFLFETHFTCEALGQKQLILVKGCAAANAEPIEKLTKLTKDVFKEWSSGESSILLILPENTTKEVNCLTETSVNGGAFELSAETGTVENETNVEVLLMNK